MNITLCFGIDRVDWQEVCHVLELAMLGKRDPEKLRRASEISHLVCTAWDGATLVGFGRALSDGEYYSAIYDVAVLPEYQGKGVGRAMMVALMERLPQGSVLIYVVPGKEGFYQKLGFGKLRTGMGHFPNLERARAAGYVE